FLWIAYLGVRYGIKATATELEPETLYVEEHPDAYEDRTGLSVGSGIGVGGVGADRTDVGDADDPDLPSSRSRYASDRRDEDQP
ncbi:hypothetical protein, partial [Rhodococcus yananensis]|uniref:hypothetical protein n=1 Tax=Rhodococcus yananensis TaxID=2879464 RepID=UPI001CF7F7CE